MLLSTQAIVLHTTPFSETSVIAQVFTRQLGLKTYISKGARGGRGKGRTALLQPMRQLDMVVYDTPKKDINHIKEMQMSHPANGNTISTLRTSLLFFMNEVLYKTLRADEPNQPLFDYVDKAISDLDNGQPDAAFPIQYLLMVARYLGIEPYDNYSMHERVFNMNEGRFQSSPSMVYLSEHPQARFFNVEQSQHLHQYLSALHSNEPMPTLSLQQRRGLIDYLLDYYQAHLPSFKNFQSHHVLHEVLR